MVDILTPKCINFLKFLSLRNTKYNPLKQKYFIIFDRRPCQKRLLKFYMFILKIKYLVKFVFTYRIQIVFAKYKKIYYPLSIYSTSLSPKESNLSSCICSVFLMSVTSAVFLYLDTGVSAPTGKALCLTTSQFHP